MGGRHEALQLPCVGCRSEGSQHLPSMRFLRLEIPIVRFNVEPLFSEPIQITVPCGKKLAHPTPIHVPCPNTNDYIWNLNLLSNLDELPSRGCQCRLPSSRRFDIDPWEFCPLGYIEGQLTNGKGE